MEKDYIYVEDDVGSAGGFRLTTEWLDCIKLCGSFMVDPYFDLEPRGKRTDFHIITVSTSLGHCLKVTLKRSLDLGCGRSSKVQTVAE